MIDDLCTYGMQRFSSTAQKVVGFSVHLWKIIDIVVSYRELCDFKPQGIYGLTPDDLSSSLYANEALLLGKGKNGS